MIVFLYDLSVDTVQYGTWNVGNAYRILVKNFEEKRPIGRSSCRWEDSTVHSYFKEWHLRV
jgi:hypothetical protein